ncbi:putative PurR-regulated permease PerM [Clostridium acetobutylicum]|uniref:Predicted permease n=1 Tax=Clostridium acetobutylicum (strain ATCC 824 / DSM 792 / JCM 1419 / IAM 19013 / LMG 5710 / NBRC 13948 / NRRL B-527 / VKM B-1787 / 2291 / W) TaxID=272562 RepID=Q97L36_CLOAB|nr:MULTISPECIES: AI-2E family transporter [Clostridium]AAK78706.1 Predicted permease [Clostridium acetobutylicum ATCC 824]ADZ19780.1 permease [Clostridium acetobutylicum EA 2018]AEI33819.1 permease [Clostridium acetobutylicum DSM 1731]AWV80425.1 AI-2E family transporter [Clostridium acetobutylicum]MBC2392615.1 AI-2E family transporter [Clostridium acetobutylicum]
MKLEERIKSKITILVFIAILMYFLLNYGNDVRGIINNIYSIFFPFILGGCIAFILNIPVTFFSKKLLNCKIKFIGKVVRKYNISISIVASCILIIGIFALISAIIIPNIIQTIKILPNAFDNSITAFQKFVNENSWMSKNVTSLVNNLNIDWNGILNKVKITIITGASSVFMSTLGAATTFASTAIEFVLSFIFSIYILAQKNKLGTQVKMVLYAFFKKQKVDSALEVLKLTSNTFSNFITGQCTVSIILGVMFFIVMTILKLPYAIEVSIIIAFFSVIPMIGSIIGFVLSVLLLLIFNPIKAGVFVFVFLAIKQVEDNFIYPKIVGNSVGLPSILVLVAITLGGKVLGVPGMIMSIPLFSVAYVLLRKEVYTRLEKKALKVE